MPSVLFFSDEIPFKLKQRRKIISWIKSSLENEGYTLKTLNFIFCSDESLLAKNIQYLRHKTFTDVITFDLSEKKRLIEGEIYISIDRIHDNALKFSKPFEDELHRVLIHGVLHLAGYRDKTADQKAAIRKREDYYLKKRIR
jgi:probable rRNA maturation factor